MAVASERSKIDIRADNKGYSTKVTALGNGFGLRVLRNNAIVFQSYVKKKADIGPALKEMLRWIDKCGHRSPMATASRERNIRKHTPHLELKIQMLPY